MRTLKRNCKLCKLKKGLIYTDSYIKIFQSKLGNKIKFLVVPIYHSKKITIDLRVEALEKLLNYTDKYISEIPEIYINSKDTHWNLYTIIKPKKRRKNEQRK